MKKAEKEIKEEFTERGKQMEQLVSIFFYFFFKLMLNFLMKNIYHY